jgi:hypothetical protein
MTRPINRYFRSSMKKLTLIFSLLAIAGLGQMSAQTTAPKYSNEFLQIGVGARALGMSNSQVSVANDVTSGYWNPSGLLRMEEDLEVGAMHAEYFAGIAKYDYGAVGKKLDENNAIGFSVIRFGVDDIPNTTELIDAEGNIDTDRITRFSAADYGFIFSYARQTSIPGLSLGANAKVIYRKIGDFAQSWGFGLDAGAQYETGKWRFGAMARDVTSTFNAWQMTLDERTIEVFEQTGNEIPGNSIEVTLPKLILGASRDFQITEKVGLLAAIDFDISTDGQRNVLVSADPVSVDPHLGLEADYMDIVYIRAGVGNVQRVKTLLNEDDFTFQPNMGIGLKIKSFTLDYALTDIGDVSGALYSNVFSLKFGL